MANTIIEAFVMSAVKRNLGKNLELLIGRKAGIKRKLYVIYADLEVYTLLR
jgi:hypothetical protein